MLITQNKALDINMIHPHSSIFKHSNFCYRVFNFNKLSSTQRSQIAFKHCTGQKLNLCDNKVFTGITN